MPYWKSQNVKFTKQSEYKADTIVTQQDLQNIQNGIKINQFYQIQPAEVLDVILSPIQQNRGKICHIVGRLLYSNDNIQQNQRIYIKPIFDNLYIPVTGELILTLRGPSIQSYSLQQNSVQSTIYYYIGIIPFYNSINHNSVKNLSTSNMQKQKQTDKNFKVGQNFRNNPDVYMILPEQGDTIIQSRFGSAMHFNSEAGAGLLPNILISNNINKNKILDLYVKEDINVDGSSIYLMSNKDTSTNIQFSTDKYESIQSISNLINNQIIINSDKIFLNSKVNEVAIFGKTNILLSSNDIIGLESSKISILSDILQIGNDKTTIESDNITLSADKIYIGSENSSQPIVLGNELVSILNDLITQIAAITVTTPAGPSGPPNNIAAINAIIPRLRTSLLSKKTKTE